MSNDVVGLIRFCMRGLSVEFLKIAVGFSIGLGLRVRVCRSESFGGNSCSMVILLGDRRACRPACLHAVQGGPVGGVALDSRGEAVRGVQVRIFGNLRLVARLVVAVASSMLGFI